ncbi:AraC-like DNA-binding protein [Paenibacillus forsythiae]|uniref:AraC-like DNA-binding protein n=1 Tax=Paenibacillus forsythiae TaxID=365616 RepID=A0ABU3H6I0_9BACL|nr:AraC family transcriptional regulator [Paenibacillus forsythiae]MDT3426423.1 AraC-like DNA-binding protein [Paenibacillus forsythiae]
MLPSKLSPASGIGRWTLHLHHAELTHVKPARKLTQLMVTQTTILVLLEGECLLKKGKSASRMRMDTVYIIHPESTYQLMAEGDSPLVAVLRVSLYEPACGQSGWLKAITGEALLLLPEEAPFHAQGVPGDRCRAICAYLRSGDPLLGLRAQIETMELLIEASSSAGAGRKDDDGLDRAKRYIEEHPAEPMSIHQLAGLAGLSSRHFSECFKKAYGKSPHEYITGVRLSKAKRLMLRSGRKLKDIAHEVGYVDEFYFSRVFKKEFGFSPSHYISRRKRKIAAYGSASTLGYLLPLDLLPYAAPLHPKWTDYYLKRYGADIPCHLDYGLSDESDDSAIALVAESQPELILCPSGTGGWEQSRLSAIAETLVLPSDTAGAWRSGLRRLARTMGMETEAESWIADFDRRTKLARTEIAGDEGAPSVLFVRMVRNRLCGLGSEGILDFAYNELGLRRPLCAPPDGNLKAAVNLKDLDADDVDFVCILVRQDSETLEYWNRLTRSPQWRLLSAVQERRIHLLSSSPWREYSPTSLTRIRTELVSEFAEKKSMPNPLSVYGG